MSPVKRFIYALAISATVHLLLLVSIYGGGGGRSGPLRIPGLLLVELMLLA